MSIFLRNALDYVLWARYGLDLRSGRSTILHAAVERTYQKKVSNDAIDTIIAGIENAAVRQLEWKNAYPELKDAFLPDPVLRRYSPVAIDRWMERIIWSLSVLHSIYDRYAAHGDPLGEIGVYAKIQRPVSAAEIHDYFLGVFKNNGRPLTLTSRPNEIVETAAASAFEEATMRGAYLAAPEYAEDTLAAKNSGTRRIVDAIWNLYHFPQPFEDWHDALCRLLREDFEHIETRTGERAFTYGNAQKWVNVTLKNLSVLSALYREWAPHSSFSRGMGRTVEAWQPELHVPVDRFLLAAASDIGVELPLRDPTKKRTKANELPWSTWENPSLYRKFQRDLADRVAPQSPMEWQGRAWIDSNRAAKAGAKKAC